MDGRVVDLGDARLSPAERAFRYGDGLFATLLARDGRLLDATAHLVRLAAGCRRLGLQLPPELDGPDSLREVIRAMAPAEGDFVLRIQVSAGTGARGYGRAGAGDLSWALVETAPVPEPRSLRLALPRHDDALPLPPLPDVKTCSALPHVLAAALAAERDADEILRTDGGIVLEAASANLFWVDGDVLCTPDANLPLYPGVTREVVLRTARELGMSVREPRVTVGVLKRAAALFLTNATRGIEPVVRLDGRKRGWPDSMEELRSAVEAERLAGALPLWDPPPIG